MGHQRTLAHAHQSQQYGHCGSGNGFYPVQVGRIKQSAIRKYPPSYLGILHRLMKCNNEEYLIKKVETLIQEMGEFIQFVSDNMRDK